MRHPPGGEAMPPVLQKEQKEEELNMEHFAQAAENLVASLDDDEEVINFRLLFYYVWVEEWRV